MPLRLSLKPHERLIINGCVIRNGPRRQILEIENRADVLRGNEMMDDSTAQTPARRTAYQIQIALVSKPHRADYLPLIRKGLEDLARALPRFAPHITDAEARLDEGDFFAAFRALGEVIAHEDRLFAHIEGKTA